MQTIAFNPGIFSSPKYTAILSDLHLCEEEPVHPKFPLWKKYKTKEFFFDEIFSDLLHHLKKKAGGEPIELILNGDIFDFDSVTSLPKKPTFRISWLESKRGLYPRAERAKYKIKKILQDHPLFVKSLVEFLQAGNGLIFVIGNHDLELHFSEVQDVLKTELAVHENKVEQNLRFVEWFYISNHDTLVEHGNQYDPYCVCEDPINPFIQKYNHKAIRLPFGNLACRFIVNGMGFFNPHVDSNFIMGITEYLRFFLKYMLRAQPELILTWFFGSLLTLWKTMSDHFALPVRDPMKIENRVNDIAKKANAEPRMVREMKELFSESASYNPYLVLRELWLDRAFLILLTFFLLLQVFILIRQLFSVSFFWMFIPLFFFLPFFLFYSKSIISPVSQFKEPNETVLRISGAITRVKRVVYGHTHILRHEIIGGIEHLNCGTWSPAFLDVECTKSIGHKAFVWISPSNRKADFANGSRTAQLLIFKDKKSYEATIR